MPGRTLDRMVIVDVKVTCWEADPPPHQTTEIIEFGVCLLEAANGQRIECESILARPTQSSPSLLCTQPT